VADPKNKITDDLRIDDQRTSVFEKDGEGNTTIHRYFNEEWHSYPQGGGEPVEDVAAGDDG
jgi:hypothetical protein